MTDFIFFLAVLLIAIPYTFINLVQFIAMFIHRMGVWLYLLARTKCHLGSLISCGYPTRGKHSHYAVAISNITRNLHIYQEQQRLEREKELQDEIDISPMRIPRAVASPKPNRHSPNLNHDSPKLGKFKRAEFNNEMQYNIHYNLRAFLASHWYSIILHSASRKL